MGYLNGLMKQLRTTICIRITNPKRSWVGSQTAFFFLQLQVPDDRDQRGGIASVMDRRRRSPPLSLPSIPAQFLGVGNLVGGIAGVISHSAVVVMEREKEEAG